MGKCDRSSAGPRTTSGMNGWPHSHREPWKASGHGLVGARHAVPNLDDGWTLKRKWTWAVPGLIFLGVVVLMSLIGLQDRDSDARPWNWWKYRD